MRYNKIDLTGGALIEGVMIKNEGQYAMALRKGNSDIEIVHDVYKGILGRGGFSKIPLLRGVFALIDYFIIGMKTFLFSSDFYEDNSKEEPRFIQKIINKVTGKYYEGFEMVLCITLALVLSIAGFILLPNYVMGYFGDKLVANTSKMVLVETVLRVIILFLYGMYLISKGDIRRMFRYHGAQHKVIDCLNRGNELTIRNVRMASKYDKSCQFSFVVYVLIISIIMFSVLRSDDVWIRMAIRMITIPLVAAIMYEIFLIKSSNSGIAGIFNVPDRMLQRIFVGEPSDDMIEVAIESLQAVFDWREYLGLPAEDDNTQPQMMQENMYSNNYYNDSEYSNESYNYNDVMMNNQSQFSNIGYENDNNGQYFVESHGMDNPLYTDVLNQEKTKQPMGKGYGQGTTDMYESYMQNNGYNNNYNSGYDEYTNMQYGMQPDNMYNQGQYNPGYTDDDDLKLLDRYFTDDNY